jgi:UPF0716 family protein affecting phage T7 exclusion
MSAPQMAGLLLLNPGMVFLALLSGLACLLCTLVRRRRRQAGLRRHRRYSTTTPYRYFKQRQEYKEMH